jgi:hypothetical protein
MENLEQLATAIRNKNAVDESIARIIGRPALIGHTGEYIAANIFNIKLEQSAAAKSPYGHFATGALRGKSVDIKWYTKMEGLLDISPDTPPDYYLVFTGPIGSATSSRETTRPWLISFVYLFDSRDLLNQIDERKIKQGAATGVARQLWQDAELYPEPKNNAFSLNNEQLRLIRLFSPL